MRREMADFELGVYYSENNISHTLNVRLKTFTDEDSDEPTSAVEMRIRKSISFKPNMPMLSRQGFIDLMNIEYHKDLDRAHEFINRAIKAYEIWSGLGEMPRDVLPEQSLSTSKSSDPVKSSETKSVDSKPVEFKTMELQPKEIDPVTKTGEAEEEAKEESVAHEIEQDPELSSPAIPLSIKGGEVKVEALLNKEEFDQSESSETGEEKPSPKIQAEEVDGKKDVKDDKHADHPKSVGARQAKVDDESSESRSVKSEDNDLYKED